MTQDKCKQKYELEKRKFLDKLREIDSETPANPDYPYLEPDWWLRMSELAKYIEEMA